VALGVVVGLAWASDGPGARVSGADGPAPGRRADQEALKAYAPLVGSWRGVGQVERGRAKGAWTESAAWAWSLTRDSAALEVNVARGKHLKSGKLRPGKDPATFAFDAVLADGTRRTFSGKPAGSADKKLVLTSDGPPRADGSGTPAVRRITFTPLHDTRLLALFEAEDSDRPGAFTRLGEVGYTREGVAFAAGESYPLCIVTEGRGTIPISYKGKTYYVCCSGCRDLFNENPEAVLAEAAARAKEKDKK
jgi:YHS domain-containing protein